MRSHRIRARRLGAVVASLALAVTFVGTATAATPQVTCVRQAPTISFMPPVLDMPQSGGPAFVQVSITDRDSPGCTAFQVFDWQWQPKKILGDARISALLVTNSGAAIKGGQTATALIRVYGFAPVGSTAIFSFTASRQDRPTLTPGSALFGVRIVGSDPR